MNRNALPKKIIRLDDGAEFLLNEVTQTYSLWYAGCENHLSHEYTFERLMKDSRCKGDFKVADGKEDLTAMRKAWFEKVKREDFGHDDE
jgi:hypothetical protein